MIISTLFLTVVKTHSFSVQPKNSKQVGHSQPPHCRIREYFDSELFKRTANGVEVTDAGATLKETAEKILQQAQDAKTKISLSKLSLSGTIRIVASTIPGEHIIPSLITEFQKKCPDVKFKIKAEDSLNSLASLQINNADFAAVGTLQGFEEKFDFLQIGEEQLVLIVPCNHKLSNHKTTKLEEIIAYPFINREETSGTRKEIEKLLQKNNIPPLKLHVALELGSTESIITAVSEVRGISIISSIAAKKAQAAGLIRIIKIEEAKTPRKLYIARPKRSLLKPSEAFWGFCRDYKFKNEAISCSTE